MFTTYLGTDDLDRYRWEIERNAEALLVDCMADQGFEFYLDQPLPPGPSKADLESSDFALTDGFGIVSGFRNWIANLNLDTVHRDRNLEYLSTLDASQVQRYFVALDGEQPEPGQLPDDSSCRAASATDAYRDWARLLEILPNYTAIGEERDTHPEWVAAGTAWAACIATRGLDYVEPDAIRSDVTRRMNTALAEHYPDGNLPILPTPDGWIVDPDVEPLLDELQAFELDAARAHAECIEPLADRFNEVERQVQQAFVDRNQDRIDELFNY